MGVETVPGIRLDDRGRRIEPRASSMNERVLLFTDVVDSTRLVERLGDARAAEVWAAHDRRARNLLALQNGYEMRRADGLFLMFDEPVDALRYAFAYHAATADLELKAAR